MASILEPSTRLQAQRIIESARLAAIHQHGELQGGMRRWVHHLTEECEEAVAEMWAMEVKHGPGQQHEIRMRMLAELAQVAQLAQSMMVLLLMQKEREEKEPWGAKDRAEELNVQTDPS